MNDEQLDELNTFPAEMLTEEERAELAAREDLRRREKLMDALGASAQAMINEAVNARNQSGVERRWEEDLANYYGSDLGVAPKTVVDRASQDKKATDGEIASKSTIGVNITRPKTNAAAARIIEMATPTDERNFALKASPNPRLSESRYSKRPMADQGRPMTNADGTPVTEGQLADQEIAEAERRATGMQREVDDQLSECDFTGELRHSYMDMAKLGTGIMAGPLARKVQDRRWVRMQDETGASRWKLQITDRFVPWSERVPPFDFFPDPAARGVMRNARYAVWRKFYNDRTLRDLIGQPGSLDDRIRMSLKEGPRVLSQARDPQQMRYIDGDYFFDDKLLFESYLVFAMFSLEELEAAGAPVGEVPEHFLQQGQVPGQVLIVNGRAVKVALSPLDSGELPFDMMHYERIDNQPWGVGVPFIIRNPQRTVRACWRMVMENAAQNVGSQIVVNKDLIHPANDSWEMTGRKVWYMQSKVGKAASAPMKVEDAFGQFVPESRIDHLLKIIEFALKFAEDETSLPALLEGRRGNAPDTVGGMQLLDNRANEVLMRLVRQNDDDLIKPHLTRYVDWNMQFSEDEEIKGDLQLIPLSASAMRAKTIEAEALSMIGQYVLHPSLQRFHKKGGYDWLRRVYQLVRLDPDSILETPERAQQLLEDAAKQPPPEDPRIAVAKVNADVKVATEQMRADVAQAIEGSRAELTKNVEMLRFQAKMTEIAETLAAQQQITVEQAKGRLMGIMAQIGSSERLQQAEMALKLSPQNPTNEGI